MSLNLRLAFSWLVVLGAASLSSAQEWSRFRGLNGDGLSDAKFPAKFAKTDYAWKIELPGGGHSSPVLWGDKIFLTAGEDESGRQSMLCLSAKDGSTLWRRDQDAHTYKLHMNNSYASSTPAADAEHAYFCWSTPEELSLVALNHDGTNAWRASLGTFVSQHGGGQSPVVVGDVVLLADVQEGQASFLFGIDRKTGQVKWRTPLARTDKFCPASPCIYKPKDGPEQAVFLTKVEGMVGVDPQTGKILWQSPGVFDARAVGSALVYNDIIFGSCGDGPKGHQLAAVRPGANGQPGQRAWITEDDTPYVTTMLVKNGVLFCWGDNGILTCRKPETGKIIWQSRVPGTYFGSPVCANNIIYTISQTGEVIAVAASPEKYELLGRTPLGEKSLATPAIAGGKMFLRTYTHLYCVNGK